MRIPADRIHQWDPPPAEARAIQQRLAGLVCRRTATARLEYVAGCDVSYDARINRFFGAVLLFRLPGMELVEEQSSHGQISYPYVPGLLSFREAPVLLQALAKLTRRPDVIMVDGHGYAHPRRFGLASHLGVLLEVPSVGCAKRRLVGSYEPPGPDVGDWSELRDGEEVIGAVLRTRVATKPMFISIGHLITLPDAVRLALDTSGGYKMPEPTRQADRRVGLARKAYLRAITAVHSRPEADRPDH